MRAASVLLVLTMVVAGCDSNVIRTTSTTVDPSTTSTATVGSSPTSPDGETTTTSASGTERGGETIGVTDRVTIVITDPEDK